MKPNGQLHVLLQHGLGSSSYTGAIGVVESITPAAYTEESWELMLLLFMPPILALGLAGNGNSSVCAQANTLFITHGALKQLFSMFVEYEDRND